MPPSTARQDRCCRPVRALCESRFPARRSWRARVGCVPGDLAGHALQGVAADDGVAQAMGDAGAGDADPEVWIVRLEDGFHFEEWGRARFELDISFGAVALPSALVV